MAEAPIIKRGDRFFCPECGHLMKKQPKTCPMCQLTFNGMVVDEVRSKQDPLKIPEVEEKYEEVHTQSFLWTSIAVILLLAGLAVLIIFIVRR